MKLSERVASVEPSATLAMTARAQSMRAQGIDILTLSAGEPDFDTPNNIKEAAIAAIERGDTKYTPVAGSAALRQAAVAMTRRVYNRDVEVRQVTVGTGGKQVLFNGICALLNPGDECLFASPYWVSYPDIVRFAGGKPVPVPVDESKGFLPKADDFAGAITAKTRLIILNSPSNPTGACYTEAELRAIGDMLHKQPQIAVITDDIYSGLVYDAPFISIAHTHPQLFDRMLIATGVSKTYAMTGWRIGLGIGPADWIGAINDLQGASTSGASSIAQAAAQEALAGTQAPVKAMCATFKARRDRMVKGLQSIPKLQILAPQGAFYAFPRIDAYLAGTVKTSHALCEHLLEQAHLAVVPGSAFGSEPHLRISFACGDHAIDEGVARLRRGLESL